MSQHLDAALLDRFTSRELSIDELHAIETHLASCEVCAAEAMQRATPSLVALRAAFEDEPEVLEHPDLRAYARGRGDAVERELIASHLDECSLCVARVRELQSRANAARRWRWIAVAAAAMLLAGLFLWMRSTRVVAPPAQQPEKRIVRQPPPKAPAPNIEPAPVEIVHRSSDPQWDALVSEARQSGRITLPSELAQLRAANEVLRGASGEVDVVSPAGRVVDDVRPTFRWPARADATYVVSIFDGDRELTHSDVLHETQWTPRADLPRGRTLTWQVEATRGGAIETIPQPPAPPAMFRIVRASEHRDLLRAHQEHPDDALLLGILYARAGMIEEATSSLKRAARSDADAQKLLTSLTRSR